MKTILILLVIFAALLGFVYFYEIQGEKGREEAKEKQQKLVNLERDQIVEIELTRGEKPLLLQKSGGEWSIRKPIDTKADQNAVDSLLGALTSARSDTRLEKPGALTEYGLAQPRLRIRVKSAKEQRTLLIGANDFTGSQVYVQAQGTPDICLTSDYLFTSANKDLKDFRDRKALEFDRSRVQSLEIQKPGELIRLKREGEKWNLESPIRDRADGGAVSGLLSTLEYAEAKDFVTEQPDDLKTFGLDKPELTVRIRQQGSDSWRTLEFGAKHDSQYYAHDTSRSPVFTVDAETYSKVAQPVLGLRDKSLVDVEQDRVSRLVYKHGDQEVAVKHQNDGKWMIEKPDKLKGKEALSYKIWYPLADVRLETLEQTPAGPGGQPGKPDIEVTLTLKDGRNLVYQFVQQGDKYLARRIDTGRGGTITKDAFEALQIKPEDLV